MAPSKTEKRKKDSRGFNGGEKKISTSSSSLCCVPKEKVACLKPEIVDWSRVEKVVCNSPHCDQSGFMHTECFNKFEGLVSQFLSKQGRGRTWNEKQRLANMWTNKGYDIVFKFCVCDCGHGSIKKDPDFVPPRPEPVAGAAALQVPDNQDNNVGNAAAVNNDKKKKRKEKTNLKPKLNFNPQNVTGSYFGSSRQKEDEETEATIRMTKRRLSSSDKSETAPAPAIPGLVTTSSSAIPIVNNNIKQTRKKSISESPEDGWVKVPSSNSRRGSKSQEDFKAIVPDSFPRLSTSEKSRSVTPASVTLDSPVRVKQLPMFQPPAPDKFYETSSSLRYECGVQAPIGSNPKKKSSVQYFGARPKLSPSFSDDVYLSEDEDGAGHPGPGSPVSTPNWSDFSCRSPNNPDKEMDDLFEQTKQFERELNFLTPDKDETRDSNGFYNCNSCKTVHESLDDYDNHLRSEKHIWADRLANDLLNVTSLKGGWENINISKDIWQQSPDKYVEGVTEQEFEEFKTELKQFRKQLEKEKQEKEELSGLYQELKVKYETEIVAKEVQELKFKEFKETALKIAKDERVNFDQKIEESQKEIMEMKSIIDNLTKQVKTYQEMDTGDTGNTAGSGDDSSKQKISELEERVHDLTTEKDNLKKELDSEIEKSIKRLNDTNKNLNELLKEKSEIQKENEDVKKENEELNSKLKEMEASLKEEKLNDLVKHQDETMHQQQQLIKEMQKVNVDIKKVNEELSSKVKEMETRLKEEMRKKIVAELEVRKLNDLVKHQDETMKIYEEQNKELYNKIDSIEELHKNIKSKVNTLSVDAVDIEELHKNIKSKVNTLSVDAADLKDETKFGSKQSDNDDDSEPENEGKDQDDERNTVFELFDEVLSKRKNKTESVTNNENTPSNENVEATETKPNIVKVKVPSTGDIYQINLDKDKPDSFESDEARIEWEKEKKRKAMIYKDFVESGRFGLRKKVNERRNIREEGSVKEDCNESNPKVFRNELSNIINDSIKDDTLRNCLTSIIEHQDQDQKKEENDITRDDKVDEDEDVVDPYDTLDKYPQLGLDEEIDPYLGEDKPGEFDHYLKSETDEDSCDEFESSEEIIQEDEDESNDEEHKLLPKVAPSVEVPELERIQDKEDESNEDLEQINHDEVQENDDNVSGEAIKLNYDDVEDLEKIEMKKCSSVNEVKSEFFNFSDYPQPDNNVDDDNDMGKRMDEMNDEELREHMKKLNECTSKDMDIFKMRMKLKTTTEMLMELPPDEDDKVVPRPAIRKMSSSSVESSNSTQNDCSSLSSDSSIHQPSDERMTNLERTVSSLQTLVYGLTNQVSTLSSKVEDSNFEAGLLAKTVECLQEKNTKLTEIVDELEVKNSVLEKRFLDVNKGSSTNQEVNGLRDSFLEILSSCENFQTSFDSMSDQQIVLDQKLETVIANFDETKVENLELKEEFAKLSDKFSSLKLEFQVDKSQSKVQMDNLAYNLAVVSNNKVPPESFSSTSGVKSGDISDGDDLDKVGSLAFLDLKENIKPDSKNKDEPSTSTTKTTNSSPSKTKNSGSKRIFYPSVSDTTTSPGQAAAAMLHYGGVLPAANPRPPPTHQRMPPLPALYPTYTGQIYAHGPGSVYPAPAIFYRYNN